jgi:hypothetical protein
MSLAYLPSRRSTRSTEDNPPANPSKTSTEGSPPANRPTTSTSRSSIDTVQRVLTAYPENRHITEPAQANFTKVRVEVPRNVHFLDARNNEVAGFWQNGSIVWEEVHEWMHIVIENPPSNYAPFQCLEAGDPEDPAGQHGPPIHMANNRSTVGTGYYVLLALDGECGITNLFPRRTDKLPQVPTQRSTSLLKQLSRVAFRTVSGNQILGLVFQARLILLHLF